MASVSSKNNEFKEYALHKQFKFPVPPSTQKTELRSQTSNIQIVTNQIKVNYTQEETQGLFYPNTESIVKKLHN